MSLAGARKLFDGAFSVRPLGHVFQIGGFDPIAESGDDSSAAHFMLIGPAEIADWPEIDEADFQFTRGAGLQGRGSDREQRHRPTWLDFFTALLRVWQRRNACFSSCARRIPDDAAHHE